MTMGTPSTHGTAQGDVDGVMKDFAQQSGVRGGSGAMFDQIAERYDTLNRIISLGIDQSWRRKTVAALGLSDGDEVLDLATGTGDLAMAIAQSANVHVVGSDPSVGMLAVGRRKVSDSPLHDRVLLEEGDAQALPYEENRFDGCTMAFGIRNVPDRERALREMARVVRSGGVVAILELGEPRQGILGPLARFHIHHVVPRLGAWLSGSREYRYLQRSIAAFPEPHVFAGQMQSAGLIDVCVEPLTFGVAHLYTARVP